MKLKQIILSLSVIVMSSAGFATLFTGTTFAASCAGVSTSIISCKASSGGSATSDSGAWQLLLIVLNIMTAGVGIAAVGGIVFGSLLYTTAGDKAEQTKKAIGIITNVVIGLVAYGLMYVGLNFLIPGGIFS